MPRKLKHLPSGLSMSESYVFRRCGHELMFQSLSWYLPHPHESERVESIRVLVVVIVVVHGALVRGDESALGKEGTIVQSHILHDPSGNRGCTQSRTFSPFSESIVTTA